MSRPPCPAVPKKHRQRAGRALSLGQKRKTDRREIRRKDTALLAREPTRGITTGTSAEAFSPELACTRAQVVTLLHRAYQGK